MEVTITAAGYGALGGQVMETLPDGFSYLSSSLSGVEEVVAVVDQAVTFTLLGDETDHIHVYCYCLQHEDRAYSFSGVLRNENLQLNRPVGSAFTAS